MVVCFTLKHQCHFGFKYYPNIITLEDLEKLWLKKEIKDGHDNMIAYYSCPMWVVKNCIASAL